MLLSPSCYMLDDESGWPWLSATLPSYTSCTGLTRVFSPDPSITHLSHCSATASGTWEILVNGPIFLRMVPIIYQLYYRMYETIYLMFRDIIICHCWEMRKLPVCLAWGKLKNLLSWRNWEVHWFVHHPIRRSQCQKKTFTGSLLSWFCVYQFTLSFLWVQMHLEIFKWIKHWCLLKVNRYNIYHCLWEINVSNNWFQWDCQFVL